MTSLHSLPAKLVVPSGRQALPRQRLFRLLDEFRPLVWITGAPGAGKTSLMASYLHHAGQQAFWYRCDRQDNDPANFFHYLGQYAGLSDVALTAEYRTDLAAFARRCFRRLFETGQAPGLWIFDDCHELADDSPFFAILSEAITELPADRRFVFASRRTSPQTWARSVINGEMRVIEAAALMFDYAEAGALAELVGHRHTSVQDLLDQSGGWAAGLTLLMASGAAAPDGSGGDQSRLFDYFAGEIFATMDDEVRQLLLATAVFPAMNAEMATAISGNPNAATLLDELVGERLFVQTLPGQPPSYRIHDLFRAFLLAWRDKHLAPEIRRDQALQAAALLVETGLTGDAIAVLQQHAEWLASVALIREHAAGMLADGRHQTLAGWINALPEAHHDGWLAYWMGQCLLPQDPAQARVWLKQAARRFETDADAAGIYLAWCAKVESWVNEWNQVGPLCESVTELESLLLRHPLPSAEIGGRVAIGMFAALMYGQPDHPSLDEWVARVRAIVLEAPDPRLRLEIGSHLLIYFTWWRGDLAAAGHLMDLLAPLARQVDMPPLARILWCAMSAGYLWMTAQNKDAVASVEHGLALTAEHSLPLLDFLLCAQGAFATLSGKTPGDARRYLDRMAATLGSHRRLDALLYHYLAAWDALSRDNPDLAASHAQAARADVEASGSPFHTANAAVCLGLLLFRRGETEAAQAAMEQALLLARQARNRAVEYQALLHLADFGLRQGHRAAGLSSLGEALALARRQGFRNHAFWRDEDMARLYAEALSAGLEPEYVKQMIRLRELAPPNGALAEADWPWRFRLRVLGALALERDGEPLALSAASAKAVELLKALVALGGQGVPVTRLTDLLWPDAEGDQARRSFDTTLHRLRRLLGDDSAITLEGGLLSLDRQRWHVDAFALHALLDAAQAANAPAMLERIRLLYAGDFLAGDEATWTHEPRLRLRARLVRALLALAVRLEPADALAALQLAYDADPLSELAAQEYMRKAAEQGLRGEALAVFERLSAALLAAHGVAPSARTKAMRAEVVGK